MDNARRRWWLRLETLAAVLVIAVASVDALMRLTVSAVPGYRQQLANWIGTELHARVRIGSLHLSWVDAAPALAATDVEWLDADGRPRLHAAAVTLGFSWSRLLTADPRPDKLALAGLDLRARRNTDGSWSVLALASPASSQPPRLRHLIEGFTELRLRGCRFRLEGVARKPLDLRADRLRLTRGAQGFALVAVIEPPSALARRLELRANVHGDLLRRSSWSGPWHADLSGIRALPWLNAALDAAVDFTGARLGFDGRLVDGRPDRLRVLASFGAISALRHGTPRKVLHDVYVSGAYRATPHGGRVRIDGLTATGARGAWPRTGGSVNWRDAADGSVTADVRLGFLRLDDLAPWLALWPQAPGPVKALRGIRGDVRRVAFTLRREPPPTSSRWHLDATLDDAGWRDAAGREIDGLFGTLQLGDTGGELVIADSVPRLRWPGQLAAPLQFRHFGGQFLLRRDNGDLQVSATGLGWAAAGIAGSTSLQVDVPAAGIAHLSMQTQLHAPDVTSAAHYLPSGLGAGLRRWLTQAIHDGRVDDGRVRIDTQLGPRAPPPQWNADLDVSGFDLDYAPGWPPLRKLAAKLHLGNDGLVLSDGRGDIAQLVASGIGARIDGWQDPTLAVAGHLQGDAAGFYTALKDSPFHARLPGLLDHTTATGPATLDLDLRVPLDRDGDVGAAGSVGLDGVRLTVNGLEQPFTAVGGRVRFGAQGFAANDLSGQWDGLPLRGAIAPVDGVPTLTLDFSAAPGADDGPAGEFVPAWLRAHLRGSTDWQARFPLAGDEPVVTVTSDLTGVSSDLPPPLSKTSAATLPVAMYLSTAEAQQRVGVVLRPPSADPLALALRYAVGGRLAGLALRLGADVPPRPVPDGVRVGGRVGQLDLRSVLSLARLISAEKPLPAGAGPDHCAGRAAASAPEAAVGSQRCGEPPASASSRATVVPATPVGAQSRPVSSAGSGPAFAGGDLKIGRLTFGRAVADDVELALHAAPASGGFIAEMTGGLDGTLRWSPTDGTVLGSFSRIALESMTSEAPTGPGHGAPLDPRQEPTVDLRGQQVKIGDYDLGRLKLVTERIPDGQRMTELSLSGGQVDLSAHGTWTRSDGVSSAQTRFALNGHRLGDLLQAFGFARSVTARRASIVGNLTWPTASQGLDLALARGRIELKLEHGALRAVHPGAGRVLGLFNLYALPRRLTLNFHDLTSQGLVYDHIHGAFELGGGQAVTHDLAITGPSLNMKIAGRIGLAARDYDEHVKVYPHVTTGVTLGAALAAGPAAPLVAPLALLAQWLLDKPLDKITHLDYRVTGSWDDPKVTRGDVAPAAGASTAPVSKGNADDQNG